MSLNHLFLRQALTATVLISAALLTGCSHQTPPPAPSPAAIAGAALQEATDRYRAGFREVVAENATNAGGMPCDKACWHLNHLERDDMGVISGAYQAAKAAYAGSAEPEPQELTKWNDTFTTVRADITAWAAADMSGGVGKHSTAAESQIIAGLDKADALINAFAPASARATAAASRR